MLHLDSLAVLVVLVVLVVIVVLVVLVKVVVLVVLAVLAVLVSSKSSTSSTSSTSSKSSTSSTSSTSSASSTSRSCSTSSTSSNSCTSCTSSTSSTGSTSSTNSTKLVLNWWITSFRLGPALYDRLKKQKKNNFDLLKTKTLTALFARNPYMSYTDRSVQSMFASIFHCTSWFIRGSIMGHHNFLFVFFFYSGVSTNCCASLRLLISNDTVRTA